jgi:aminoglycoside phosphotransferase
MSRPGPSPEPEKELETEAERLAWLRQQAIQQRSQAHDSRRPAFQL